MPYLMIYTHARSHAHTHAISNWHHTHTNIVFSCQEEKEPSRIRLMSNIFFFCIHLRTHIRDTFIQDVTNKQKECSQENVTTTQRFWVSVCGQVIKRYSTKMLCFRLFQTFQTIDCEEREKCIFDRFGFVLHTFFYNTFIHTDTSEKVCLQFPSLFYSLKCVQFSCLCVCLVYHHCVPIKNI